jgi:hypothetical protein
VNKRPAYGPLTVRSRSAHGPLTFRSRPAHGPPTARPRPTHGPHTAHSRPAHGQITVPHSLVGLSNGNTSFSLCCTGWTQFRPISQSIASHIRDAATILGQSTWNLWWANRYSKDLSVRSPVLFPPLGIGNYLWWIPNTHLHCMLMSLCTQIWTCFITNSISLNKEQFRNAAIVWRKYIFKHQ